MEKLLDFGSRLQGCLEECSSKSGNDVLASEVPGSVSVLMLNAQH